MGFTDVGGKIVLCLDHFNFLSLKNTIALCPERSEVFVYLIAVSWFTLVVVIIQIVLNRTLKTVEFFTIAQISQ